MKKSFYLLISIAMVLMMALNTACDSKDSSSEDSNHSKSSTTAKTTEAKSSQTTAESSSSSSKDLKFDALKDFDKNNNGPVWFYEVTNGEGAWEKVTEYHEEWDGFYGVGAYGNAGVYGGASCSGLAPAYESTTGVSHDVSFKFVCPETGEITIEESLLESKSDPSRKGAEVSILHKEQKVWSDTFDKSGADANGKKVPQQKLSVTKGDVIRFKAHSLDNTSGNNGSFVWDIKVNYN